MLWNLVNQPSLLEYETKVLNGQWLRKDLVHSMLECFLDVSGFGVACDSYDPWLPFSKDVHAVESKPDLTGCLEAIHERHLTVH